MLTVKDITFTWRPDTVSNKLMGGNWGKGILTFTVASDSCSEKKQRFHLSGSQAYGMTMEQVEVKPTAEGEGENMVLRHETKKFHFYPDLVSTQLSETMIASVIMSVIRMSTVSCIMVMDIKDIVFSRETLERDFGDSIFTLYQVPYERLVDVARKQTNKPVLEEGKEITLTDEELAQDGLTYRHEEE